MIDYEIPTLDLPPAEEPEQLTVRETVRRMTEVLTTGQAPERDTVDLGAMFDRGAATLVLEDAPPQLNIRNPVATGSKSRKGGGRQRPAGAEDLQGLFATGFILLTAFTLGEWAQPTPEESLAIAAPLGNILARRIDLAQKLGRDASDTVALAIALLTYLSRVGPVAVERAREGYATRSRRERVVRDQRPPNRHPDDGGQGGVAAGPSNGAGAYDGSPFDPFHALASARESGLGILGRDLTGDTNGPPPVGHRG
jgi:hypothetical protein